MKHQRGGAISYQNGSGPHSVCAMRGLAKAAAQARRLPDRRDLCVCNRHRCKVPDLTEL